MKKRRSSAFAFGIEPSIAYRRSMFKMPHSHKTTGNLGDLIPFFVQEVYPGDTFKNTSTLLVRSSNSVLKPIIDNLFVDTWFFFVPYRLVWKNWEAFMGENKNGHWASTYTGEVPQLELSNLDEEHLPNKHDIAVYMGMVPQMNNWAASPADYGRASHSVSALPLRAYALIYNEWFRDQNVQDPINIELGDTDEEYIPGDIFGSTPEKYTGLVAKVNKVNDYFTTCLPSPQKGNAVSLPLGITAPVVTGDGSNFGTKSTSVLPPLRLTASQNNGSWGVTGIGSYNLYGITPTGFNYMQARGEQVTPAPVTTYNWAPDNLFADLTDATAANVNDLRFAFQLQKMLEKDARGGTRYREMIRAHFGVSNGDARMQIPEYLGGSRNPLRFSQVTQTSQGTKSSALGNLGAYSLSVGNARFNKSFTEHGLIIGLCAVRQFHTYQQGIERYLFRYKREHFYDPVFANIGEQPVYTKEIYAAAAPFVNDDVFGYNEAWADLRYKPSRISGELSSFSEAPLDIWHAADAYKSQPLLSSQFMQETSTYFDRDLAVPSTSADNFIFDIYNDMSAIRLLPSYSIPGLIDHH
mgnify:CR=1 FL=1